MSPVIINGRFLKQSVSGVQRYSHEILNAIDRNSQNFGDLKFTVCVPVDSNQPELKNVKIRESGKIKGVLSGYIWEHTRLLACARNQNLLNLGNTCPLRMGRRNCVVIHDASVFDVPQSYSFWFRLYYKSLHKFLAITNAKIATVSEFSKNRIAANLNIDRNKIRNVGEGGEHILRFNSNPKILEAYNLKPDRYFLIVGATANHKNIDIVYSAIQTLADRNIKWVITGKSRRPQFSTAIEIQEPNVVYVGQVDETELRALYENALSLVFPSKYEGFGLPPLEAMYCACPVVAAKTPSVIEIMGGAGLWFESDSSGQLVESIERIKKDPELRETMRRRGRKRCIEYTWDKAAINLVQYMYE